MKSLYFILIISVLFFSCEKRKEIREWKKKAGAYQSETEYLLYQDGTYTLKAKELHVNASGITCYGANDGDIGTSFGVFHKDENPKKEYDYKCQYSKIMGTKFIDGQAVEQYLSSDNFVQNREFYLSFSGSVAILTIIHSDGTIDTIEYIKK